MNLAREAEESLQRACEQSTKVISDFSKDAAKILINLAENSEDERIQLDAAKYILKITGMEIERQEVTQKTITITEEHATKIRDAAKKLTQ